MANSDLTSAKDWIYVICTVTQTIIAILGLVFVSFWWDKIKIKKAEIRERQRADAEKIAVIFSTNYYYEVENAFHKLKKTVSKFREEKIVENWTKFHALLYMCRPENWKNCNKIQESDLRDKLLSDVEILMKFFLKCRIELFSIMQNKPCPNDIKLEFSTNIAEMGKIIYPFVAEHRQNVIERVLEYFTSRVKTPDPLKPRSFLSRFRQSEEGRKTDADENLLPRASTSAIESPDADMPELIKYPGNVELENTIPYIKCFQYHETGMKLDFRWNMHPTMLKLLEQVKLGEMREKENEILEKIDELWRSCGHDPPGEELLHSVRMIMFKQSENRNFFENHFDKFEKYVQTILANNLSDKVNKLRCERTLHDIESSTQYLRKTERLLVLPGTRVMLENVKSQIETFCAGK